MTAKRGPKPKAEKLARRRGWNDRLWNQNTNPYYSKLRQGERKAWQDGWADAGFMLLIMDRYLHPNRKKTEC